MAHIVGPWVTDTRFRGLGFRAQGSGFRGLGV